METPIVRNDSASNKSLLACVRCAERKVKCDREKPACGACTSRKVDCVYQPPRPPRKRRRQVREQILLDQLKHYEALLGEKGVETGRLPDPSDISQKPSPARRSVPQASDSQSPRSVWSEANSVNKTHVIHGQGRSIFVDNSLWSRMAEEFPDAEVPLEDASHDSSDPEGTDDEFGFVLDNQPSSSSRPTHPAPNVIHDLWELFIQNVDPMTKVIHVPTMRPAIHKVASGVGPIPRSLEALVFAIYGAAVMSLDNDECMRTFGEPRRKMLSRYTSATQTALTRARFMGTTSLVVLQALIIHIFSVRDISEPRAVWCLTGVAIRIAQGMGLERDGSLLGLSPFETEMRRRVWWLLKTHDYRLAELIGQSKFRDLKIDPDSTKFPTNVDDDQLYLDMPSRPMESRSLTDMAFLALRYELLNFAAGRLADFRQSGSQSTGSQPQEWDFAFAADQQVAMDRRFEEMEAFIETKFLRYCDPSQPLHLIVSLMARSAMNTVRFLLHHPRRWTNAEQIPQSERDWVWDISIKLLEQHLVLHTNAQLKKFVWQAAFIFQWHTFIHVLDTLRADPLKADAAKAWQLVAGIFKNNPRIIHDMRRPIHVAVGGLCLKACSAREKALRRADVVESEAVPDFVQRLRRQHGLAKAKREARLARAERELSSIPDRPTTTTISSRNGWDVANAGEAVSLQSTQQNDMPPPYSSVLKPNNVEDDPFQFVNIFGNGQVGRTNDVMDWALDDLLALSQSNDLETPQAITWDQWDSWLAESNTMHPLSSTYRDFGPDS